MTDNPHLPASPVPALDQPRTLLFLAYGQMGLLDLTGAQTVFWAATKARAARGLPGYRIITASLEGGLVSTAEGLAIATEPLAPWLREPFDTLVVPGAPEIVRTLPEHGELVSWLRLAAAQARRTASVCSGTFLLAAAGLLDGRRAATHWAMCDALHQRFPAIDVDGEAIFVQQDNVWTSAGVSAGIDLALALVESDCGRGVAMEVARELVVFLKRPGGQAQFSELLKAQGEDSAAFDALHVWLNDHLDDPRLNVERLAAQARMSLRNFTRVYKQKTGRTPAKAIELFRLEAARRLLENTELHIEQIARRCGFGGEERMRLAFQRHLAVTPRDYRARFAHCVPLAEIQGSLA
ncbi:DJ-1/PfpI family protein [Pseudomonas sp. GD03858]|uniref:GlxA family transcriptional regulator n=1 Tax=unclassified Pseudomonas TaxID=196821 RepID=UPI0024480560|nr:MULTISPECIES: helix-turn-helix domain-containing protein [unclassified Pseudomonas]MDH0648895.1 DJ-1/PfpI family protein [Pseudomonas sp. GD03867]MDH0663347.1 DJ-1/PfpI family protein [Pseudomonas sp. GD03858]